MSPGRSELACLRSGSDSDSENRSHGRIRSSSYRNTHRSLETVRGISRKKCAPKFFADSASTNGYQAFRTVTPWLLSSFIWIQYEDNQANQTSSCYDLNIRALSIDNHVGHKQHQRIINRLLITPHSIETEGPTTAPILEPDFPGRHVSLVRATCRSLLGSVKYRSIFSRSRGTGHLRCFVHEQT